MTYSWSMIFSRSIHVNANGSISFFLTAELDTHTRTHTHTHTHTHAVHGVAKIWTWLSDLTTTTIYMSHLLDLVVSCLALGFLPCLGYCMQCWCEHICAGIIWISVFDLSGYIPRSGIAGSYSSYIFSFLMNFHTFFPSVYTNLHCHQQCLRVFPFLYNPSDIYYL